jgi:hypothetical protein
MLIKPTSQKFKFSRGQCRPFRSHDKFIHNMNFILKPFSESESEEIHVAASLDLWSSELLLKFRIDDPLKKLDWRADPHKPLLQRGRDLWKKTCFELFAGRRGSEIYHEFNFAPTGEWDAFSFKTYREAREDFVSSGISFNSSTQFCLNPESGTAEAHIDIRPKHGSRLQFLTFTHDFEVQVAFVALLKSGETIYFAHRHGESRPDFHRRELFTTFS